MAQLHRLSLLNHHHHLFNTNRSIDHLAFYPPSTCPKLVISPLPPNSMFLTTKFHVPLATVAGGGGGSINDGFSGGGGGRGSGGNSGGNDGDDISSSSSVGEGGFGPVGALLNGWRSRVAADPQFPFKILMEEIVGLSACVLGDMASRPNFGLNELDLVFSTLVVCFILNFTLMYILAPTTMASSGAAALPSIFGSCPTSHMFEPGPFTPLDRLGTFVYKGMLFAGVGFTAGLVGTALSNGLLMLRKKMDPSFQTPNKAPRTMLNALTWAAQVGLSANLRYQTLNGVEYALAKGLPSFLFKTCVVVLRVVNNVMGGMSFVILARLTGSQSSSDAANERRKLQVSSEEAEILAAGDEKHKLLHNNSNFESSESVSK